MELSPLEKAVAFLNALPMTQTQEEFDAEWALIPDYGGPLLEDFADTLHSTGVKPELTFVLPESITMKQAVEVRAQDAACLPYGYNSYALAA
jgi:hypothetical protein